MPVRWRSGSSAGQLNERMATRGEDDLALLATSFNGMADSLQSQIRQLEGLSAVQQRFVSDVSHELRTPLTTIRMAVDLIHESREDFEPTVGRSAELLAGELDRFEDLLADLLEISRFDAGAAALDVEPVDLRGTIEKVVEAARPLAERRGSTVTLHAPDEPAEAEVDERRVERILRNLLVNAIEHGDGRPVDIHVATGERRRRGRRRGPRRRPAPGGGRQRVHPVLARGPRPGPHHRGHRSGPVDLARGRPAAQRLAPGVGRARRRVAVPAHAAAAGRRHAARLAPAARPDGGPVTGRRAGAALAVLLALVLAGCGGLTRSGPVEPGLEVGSGNPQDLGVSFPGPVPGSDQANIVRGFVRAGSASDAAYDNARAFLTAQVSEKWDPDRNLVLLADNAAPSATLLDPATVRITASPAGTVDADGRYTAAQPGSTVTADFALTSVGGEWRISELPKGFGRWISSSLVSRLVQPYDVHYVSTSQRGLVSDTRWFPVDKLATRLARAQIDPVPAYLADAAVTAVPAGTRLLGDAVSIDSGTATVNLIQGKLGPGETTRQNLWAQFVSTLTQDAAVSRVELSVDGVPVNLAGLGESAGTLAEVGFSTPAEPPSVRPVVRRGDDVVVFDPSTLGDAEPREPAVSGSYPQVLRVFRRLALSADGVRARRGRPRR